MPEYDPNEPVRVRDKDLDREYTIRRSALPHGNYQELKGQDAVDLYGNFLPPVFDVSKSATVKKES